jgi:hypothetical protein
MHLRAHYKPMLYPVPFSRLIKNVKGEFHTAQNTLWGIKHVESICCACLKTQTDCAETILVLSKLNTS